jgi:MerR family transcriptional regulator, light-induced transcriptional regulator
LSEPRYRIGTLAKLTGVTTHAIRIWERRYNALSPKRTPGGARLYDDDDVLRLRLVKKLLDRGYTISAIATLEVKELLRLAPNDVDSVESVTSPDQSMRASQLIEELLEAIAELDLERAGRVLVQATNSFSPHDLVTTVLAPTLDELGNRWESGDICIASEHAASAMLRTQLGMLLAAQPVNGKAPVVCTTPAGEQHELGALLAAVLIAMHGRRAIYLGANLPAEQIVQAARLAKAGSVALSLVGLTPDAARHEVEALCRVLPAQVQLLVGGRRVHEMSDFPARVQVLATLPELERWLQTAPS